MMPTSYLTLAFCKTYTVSSVNDGFIDRKKINGLAWEEES